MDANQDAPHQRSFRVAYHGCPAVGPGEIAKITFFIIASAVANLHVESRHPSRNGDLDMRIIFDDGDRFGYRSVRRCFWPDGRCKRRAPSFPPDLTVSNMPKAGRTVASRATRSVRRPLRISPPNAMHLRFAMMSTGDGNAEASADSRLPIPEPLPLTAGRRPQFMRHRRDWAAPFAFACQDK
jgi:hypothetical protein